MTTMDEIETLRGELLAATTAGLATVLAGGTTAGAGFAAAGFVPFALSFALPMSAPVSGGGMLQRNMGKIWEPVPAGQGVFVRRSNCSAQNTSSI